LLVRAREWLLVRALEWLLVRARVGTEAGSCA
jgi:hypothetical protein